MPGDALWRRYYKNSLWCKSKEKCREHRFTCLDEQESLSNRLSVGVKDQFIFDDRIFNKHVFN